MYLLLIVLAIFVILILYQYVKFKSFEKFPGPKPRMPFFGNLPFVWPDNKMILKELETNMYKFYNEGLFLYFVSTKPVFVIYRKDFVEKFFKEAKTERSWMLDMMKPYYGDGIITSEGIKWKTRRALLNPLFNSTFLNKLFQTFDTNIEKMIKKIDSNSYFDVYEKINLLTFKIIIEITVGIEITDDEFKEHEELMSFLMVNSYQRNFNPIYWSDFLFSFLKISKELELHSKKVDQLYARLIDRRIQILKERNVDLSQINVNSSSPPPTVVDILLKNELTKKTIDKTGIIEELRAVVLAVLETTPIVSSWALHTLGCKQRIQNKLREQISQLKGNDKQLTKEVINHVTFADAIVKESLRMYAYPVIENARLVEPLQLGQHNLPKNSEIIILSNAIHFNENEYPNKNEFKPERFDNNENVSPFKLIVFGEGRRKCIGHRFFQQYLKHIICKIVDQYQIISATSSDQHQQILNFAEPNNLNIKFNKINK